MDIQEYLFKESLKKSLDIFNYPDHIKTQLHTIIDTGNSPAEIFKNASLYLGTLPIIWP